MSELETMHPAWVAYDEFLLEAVLGGELKGRGLRDVRAAVEAAVRADEGKRYQALEAAARFWQSHGGHAHWCVDPPESCDCGATELRAALDALAPVEVADAT